MNSLQDFQFGIIAQIMEAIVEAAVAVDVKLDQDRLCVAL
jgi:hypothetical protein